MSSLSKRPGRGPHVWRRIADAWQSIIQVSLGADGATAAKNWQYAAPPIIEAKTLDDLYDSNWLARAIIDKRVEIALRDGLGWSPEHAAAYDMLGRPADAPEGLIPRAAKLGRLHGGSLLIACHESGQGDLTQPLAPSPGALLWADVVPRSWTKILEREPADVNAARPNAPAVFEVTEGPRKGLQVHLSRCLVFAGHTPSPSTSAKSHDSFWTSSVLQTAFEELLRLGQRLASTDRITARGAVQALQIHGIMDAIANEEESDLDARLQALKSGIDLTGFALLDEGESYTPHSLQVVGLVEPSRESIEMICGAAEGTPVTVLLGISPAGLNATGKSDLDNWYNGTATYRQNYLAPNTAKLGTWLLPGKPCPIAYSPLIVPTETERWANLNAALEAAAKLEDLAAADAPALVQWLTSRGLLDGLGSPQ